MKIRINLKFKLLLVAVVVAAINADTTIDYYKNGVGTGQNFSNFDWPAGLPYINFDKLSKDDSIVKKVTIRGSFIDMMREDGGFYFHLRLQQKPEVARTIAGNAMTYALFARSSTESTISNNYDATYLYEIPDQDLRNPRRILKETSIKNYGNFKVGKEFVLTIFLQPSHMLFYLDYEDEDSCSWKQYYGYFNKETDGDDHRDTFSDSIFDSIHIEGDVKITKLEVMSGGGFNPKTALPPAQFISFKPYTKGWFEKIQELQAITFEYMYNNKNPSEQNTFIYQFFGASFEYDPKNAFAQSGDETEIIIRGYIN